MVLLAGIEPALLAELDGGLKMASDDGIDFMSSFGVMTGPKAIAERADQRIARGEYIIRLP